jgi:hypothetical protein
MLGDELGIEQLESAIDEPRREVNQRYLAGVAFD